LTLIIHNPNNLPTCALYELIPIQGGLKDLTKEGFKKIDTVIEKRGFDVPFFVWIPDHDESVTIDGEPFEIKAGMKCIIDGTQRDRWGLQKGYKDEQFPYLTFILPNFAAAKVKILEISSNYGKITQEGLDSFSWDIEPFQLGY